MDGASLEKVGEEIDEIDVRSAGTDAVREAWAALLTIGAQLAQEWKDDKTGVPYPEKRPEYRAAMERWNNARGGLAGIALEKLN